MPVFVTHGLGNFGLKDLISERCGPQRAFKHRAVADELDGGVIHGEPPDEDQQQR